MTKAPLDLLIQETLTYLKDPLTSKKSVIATQEECAFFSSTLPELPQKDVMPMEKTQPRSLPPTPIKEERGQKAQSQPIPIAEKKAPQTEPTASDNLKGIKNLLQKIAPSIATHDTPPDDTQAIRAANAYRDLYPGIDAMFLLCDAGEETLEFIKMLAKAVDQQLGKAKVISAERLEKENRWDLFLEKNKFRLIIATPGIRQMSNLRPFYNSRPATREDFLMKTPLLNLAEASTYKDLKMKVELWKSLCQMLKK